MAKSDVYSWRVSPEIKMALEFEARREGATIAALLDRMAHEWLHQRSNGKEATDQAHLHAAAAKALGSLAGGNRRRSESARAIIRKRLALRHGR